MPFAGVKTMPWGASGRAKVWISALSISEKLSRPSHWDHYLKAQIHSNHLECSLKYPFKFSHFTDTDSENWKGEDVFSQNPIQWVNIRAGNRTETCSFFSQFLSRLYDPKRRTTASLVHEASPWQNTNPWATGREWHIISVRRFSGLVVIGPCLGLDELYEDKQTESFIKTQENSASILWESGEPQPVSSQRPFLCLLLADW